MRYTQPQILNVSKAVSVIKTHAKENQLANDAANFGVYENPSTEIAAYEADE